VLVATQADGRIYNSGGNRHMLYLRSDLIEDSLFPFQPGDEVTIRIADGCLVVYPKDTLPPAEAIRPRARARKAKQVEA
jgi:hypothetical protein